MAENRQPLNSAFAQQPAAVEANQQELVNPFAELQQEQAAMQPEANIQGQAPAVTNGGNPFTELIPTEELPREAQPANPGLFGTGLGAGITDITIGSPTDTALLRAKASFGRTTESKTGILSKALGENNVRFDKKNNKFLVRLPGNKGFTDLEPQFLDIMGDMFFDSARDEVNIAAGGVAATGAGAVSFGTGAPGAFFSGVLASDAAMDQIELALGGSKPDEAGLNTVEAGTKRAADNALVASFATVFRGAGETVTKWLGPKGTDLSKRTLKELKDMPTAEPLRQTVDELTSTMDALTRQGRMIKVGDVNILPHQAIPLLPTKLAKDVAALESRQEFVNVQVLLAKNLEKGLGEMVEDAAGIARGTIPATMKRGLKTPGRGNLKDRFQNFLTDSLDKEWADAKLYLNKASSIGQKTAQPTTRTVEAFDGIAQQFGGVVEGNKFKFTQPNRMKLLFGEDGAAEVIEEELTAIGNALRKSDGIGMPVDEITERINSLSPLFKTKAGNNPAFTQVIGKLQSALRGDRRSIIDDILVDELGPQSGVVNNFRQTMGRYGQFAQTRSAFSNMMGDNPLASNVFAQDILKGGRNSVAKFQAAKTFLTQENPKLWQDIKTEFVEELFLKAADKGKLGGFKGETVVKELQRFDTGMLKELFNGADTSLIVRGLRAGDQMKKTLRFGTDDQVAKAFKNAIELSSPFRNAKLNGIRNLFSLESDNGRMLRMLNRDGVDFYLKNHPKPVQDWLRPGLTALLTNAKSSGKLATLGTSTRVVGEGIASEGTVNAVP